MSQSIRHSLASKSEKQLLRIIEEHGSDPIGQDAFRVLQDKRMEKIYDQLLNLHCLVKRPAWKTLVFWIIVMTFIISMIALFRDFFEWNA